MARYQFKERPGCMIWWLGSIIVLLFISLVQNLTGGPDQLKHLETIMPGVVIPSWMPAFGISSGLAQIGCAVALLLWKKWGFYGLVALNLIGTFITIPMAKSMHEMLAAKVGPQSASLLMIFAFTMSFLQILITYLVIRPVWDELE
jgi:hypothetical protein